MNAYNRQRGIGVLAVIAILAVIGLAGAGTYVATRDDATVDENLTEEEGAENSLSGEASIRAILSLGDNLRCTFSTVHATGKTEGVVYVAEQGEQTRGDFVTETTSEGRMESHFIRKGTTGYMWSSEMEQGIQMDIPEGQDAPASSEAASQNQTVDFDAFVSYDCEQWEVEESQFTPPANVEFMTIGEMMGNIPGMNANAEVDASAGAELEL